MNGYWMTAVIAGLALVCLVVIALLLPVPAHAQQPPPRGEACGDRIKITKFLAQKHKEVPRSMAITGGNSVMEIYLSPAGTWTALVTDVTGKTCIVASGEGWEDIAIKPAGTAL